MTGRPGTLIEPVARTRRVLGKAVHVGAVMRLHELWPEAVVRVRHETTQVPLAPGTAKMDGPRWREGHETRVIVDLEGHRHGIINIKDRIIGKATCHPDDNFDRRKGIEIAFRRALNIARGRAGC